MSTTQVSSSASTPTQLKFSVPPMMYAKLKARASHAGVQVTSYVRHLLIAGLENSPEYDRQKPDFDEYLSSLPVYEASPRVDAAYAQTMKEIKSGGAMVLRDADDVDKYFAQIEKSNKKTKLPAKKKK